MRVIYTNDGIIGLDFNKKANVIWCSQPEALEIMWSQFGKHNQFTKDHIAKDLAYGIDYCAKTGDDVMHFGCLGSFMFTTKTNRDDESF